jgi:hypothetical protein
MTTPSQNWLSSARTWLAERARNRLDALEVSRMDAHELRDLGFSHTAAAQSGMLATAYNAAMHRSWIHAQPSFGRRDAGCC